MTELGKILKEAREAKGLSLDDLQQITKIQKRYLVGIEEGNYDMMPGKFYVRAFIKQYAEAVGLDAEQLFAEHQTDIPKAVQQEEVPQNLSRVQSKKSTSIAVQDSKWVDLLPKILIAVVLIAVAAVIYYFVAKAISNNDGSETPNESNQQVQVEQGKNNAPDTEEKATEETTEDEKPAKEDEADSEDDKENEAAAGELKLASSSGNSSTYELSNADEFKVSVKSTGETWVTVRDSNGKTLFNNMITADNPQEFDQTDDTKITLNIGRSTDTEVYVNDEKVDYASDSIVQNITINYTKE
ncbi:helix-turn-helix domain-containing protein [Gracilibacillus sp. Marseille-QA3620]